MSPTFGSYLAGVGPLREWIEGDPALTPIRHEEAYPQPVYAYRVTGRLDPGGCG
jgi:hypothetical protein